MVLKSRAVFLYLGWLVVLALALTACGAQGGGSNNQGAGGTTSNAQPSAQPAQDAGNAQGGASGQAVTLRYALWNQNQVPAMEQIIAAFKAAHPNIDVAIEVTPFDQYWTKLEAAATGGSAPDLFWMNGPNFIKYAANGILMPIDDQIAADKVDLASYPEALVALYTYDGKHYALPKDFDTIGLWYNKELFDAAGVAYPDETWTWDSVREAARKLTKPEQGVWGIAAPMTNQEGFYNTIYQNGGYVISPDRTSSGYDKPETIEGLSFWTGMIEEGLSPTHAQMTETRPINMFQSGKVAMLYGGSWRQIEFAKNEYTRERVDVAPLPKGKQQAVIIHGLGNVISAKTAHPAEAWEFLKFLGSREAAEIQARTGAVIPAFNGAQNLWVASNPQFKLQVFLDQLAYAVPYPISRDTAKWQNLERDLFAQAWSGQISVEDAATQVGQQMGQILSQE